MDETLRDHDADGDVRIMVGAVAAVVLFFVLRTRLADTFSSGGNTR